MVEHWEKDDISIAPITLHHANPGRFEGLHHLGYHIRLGNTSLVHLGDAEWSNANIASFSSQSHSLNVDIAIVPFWMAIDERTINMINEHLQPTHLVLGHISPIRDWLSEEVVLEQFPKARFLKKVGEELKMKP